MTWRDVGYGVCPNCSVERRLYECDKSPGSAFCSHCSVRNHAMSFLSAEPLTRATDEEVAVRVAKYRSRLISEGKCTRCAKEPLVEGATYGERCAALRRAEYFRRKQRAA